MAASVQNGPKGPDVSRSGNGKSGTEKAGKDSAKGAQGASGATGAQGTTGPKDSKSTTTEPEKTETHAAMENQTGQTQRAAETRAQIESTRDKEQSGAPAPEKEPKSETQPSGTVDTIADAITSVGAATRNPGIAAGAAVVGMGIRAGNDLISTGSYDMGRFGEDLASTGIAFGAGLVGGVAGGRAAGVVSGAGKGLAVGTENVVGASVSTSVDAGVNTALETKEPGRGAVGALAGGLTSGHLAGLQNILGGRPGLVGRAFSQTFGRVTTREIAGETATQTGIAAGNAKTGIQVANAGTVVTDAKPQTKPAPKPVPKPAPKPAPPKVDPEEAKLANARKEVEKSLEKIEQEMKSISRSSAFMSNSERESGGSQRVEQQYRDALRRQEVIQAAQTFLNNPDRKNGVPEGALTGALGLGSKEARDAALDRMEKAGADVDTARSLSNRMEKEGWGFNELMDTSAFNYGGGNSSYGRDTFSTNIADYGDISDLSAFGGYGRNYGGGGSDHNGRGDGSYGGGMANGDPTPG